MKLTVKTLKGAKFTIEVDDVNTVEQVKAVIEQTKSELPAAGMKLIHSGKVLKDGDSISGCGIQPNDFLVVMVTKPKAAKPAAAPAPAAAATAAAPAPAAAAEPSASPAKEEAKSPTDTAASAAADAGAAAEAGTEAASATGTTDTDAAAAAASTPAPSSTTAPTPAAPSRAAFPDVSQEAIETLTSMGFPEEEVLHCLRYAGNNPDVAVEFLTNGIPLEVMSAYARQQRAASGAGDAAAASPAASSSSSPAAAQPQDSSRPLQSLRNHPQFDNLRRLVQSNPAMLQPVLTQIGQQQPELLEEINSNQALFLEMMNEPVPPAPAGSSSSTSSAPAAGGSGASSAARGGGGLGAGGLGSPGQMAALISSMGNDELQQMAAMMGISVDQLRQTANLIGSMPESELNQFMAQAMGGGGGYGMDDDDIMGGGGGGGFGGAQVVRLTEEEMAAVDRLTEMGFDRSDAAQAFLACDKNEAMAANLLMDSMGDGGGGGFFGGGPGDDNDGDNNDNDNNNNMDDDADDMYD